jgi:hypothetical protein
MARGIAIPIVRLLVLVDRNTRACLCMRAAVCVRVREFAVCGMRVRIRKCLCVHAFTTSRTNVNAQCCKCACKHLQMPIDTIPEMKKGCSIADCWSLSASKRVQYASGSSVPALLSAHGSATPSRVSDAVKGQRRRQGRLLPV